MVVDCSDCGVSNPALSEFVCALCGASLVLENFLFSILSMYPSKTLSFVMWSLDCFVQRVAKPRMSL